MSPNVVIIDYGMGNLFSVKRVIKHLGGNPIVSDNPEEIVSAERLILPGVGAFGDGMENLKKRALIKPIKEFVKSGKGLLGICLGMQLFMSESEEFGVNEGLNLVEGKVKRLPSAIEDTASYKIPHVGWNSLHFPLVQSEVHKQKWDETILGKVPVESYVYFVHSYKVIPDSYQHVLAETKYGGNSFCSVLQKDNIFACQFHPEVSGKVGLDILKEFISNF